MAKINFEYTAEFKKECRKISSKKCKTFPSDLNTIKKAMQVRIPEHCTTKRINGLGSTVKIPIYKVKRFRCAQIKKEQKVDFV